MHFSAALLLLLRSLFDLALHYLHDEGLVQAAQLQKGMCSGNCTRRKSFATHNAFENEPSDCYRVTTPFI